MIIRGRYYHEEGSSSSRDATFEVEYDEYILKVDSQICSEDKINTLKISNRIGNIERKITMSDGSMFVSYDNNQIDKILSKSNNISKLLYRLESNVGIVVVSLVVVFVSILVFFRWGLPWLSSSIAYSLPIETNRLISKNSLKLLDKYWFDKSHISKFKQQQIKTHFQSHIINRLDIKYRRDFNYTLHFRLLTDSDNHSIPNAFALPSGDIVLTDKFINLASSEDEIDLVLLHEIGHVVYHHSLRQVLQGTFMSVISILVFGDDSFISDAGVGVGAFLVSSNYAREFESDADIFAFDTMLELGIDPDSFASIMSRMQSYIQQLKKPKHKSQKSKFFTYFSSHPGIKSRVSIAKQYSKCYKNNQKTCNIIK